MASVGVISAHRLDHFEVSDHQHRLIIRRDAACADWDTSISFFSTPVAYDQVARQVAAQRLGNVIVCDFCSKRSICTNSDNALAGRPPARWHSMFAAAR